MKYVRSFYIGNQMADMIETTDVEVGITKALTTVLRNGQIPVSLIAQGDYLGGKEN